MIDRISLENKAISVLAQLPQWIVWGKNKEPLTVGGYAAKSNDRRTWSTFEKAFQAAVQGISGAIGVGFVLSKNDEFVFIDLDKCRNPETGVINEFASKICKRVGSYVEVSPSGRGLHIICRGKLPGPGRKTPEIEIYDADRYMTVTGWALDDDLEIIDAQDVVLEIYQELNKKGAQAATGMGQGVNIKGTIDDDLGPNADLYAALIANHPKFQKTWDHKRSDLPITDMSSYDLSLAIFAAQAEWSDTDIARLISMHRRMYADKYSAMTGKPGADVVSKGKRIDYLERTIAAARRMAGNHSTSAADIKEAVKDIEQDEAEQGGNQDDRLISLSNSLGCQVLDVVRRGDEPPHLIITIDANGPREVHLGRIENLLNQRLVKAKLFEAGGITLATMPAKGWDGVCQRVWMFSRYEPAPDLDESNNLEDQISEYLENHPPRPPTERAEAMNCREPYTLNGDLFISITSFHNFLLSYGLKESELTVRHKLKNRGFVYKKIRYRYRSIVETRSYYYRPINTSARGVPEDEEEI